MCKIVVGCKLSQRLFVYLKDYLYLCMDFILVAIMDSIKFYDLLLAEVSTYNQHLETDGEERKVKGFMVSPY